MTIQEIKKILYDYRTVRIRLRAEQSRLAEYESTLYSLSSPKIDGVPHGGGDGDPIGEAVTRTYELCEQTRLNLAQLTIATARAEWLISLCTDAVGHDVLHLAFTLGVHWDDIPERLHIATPTMWRAYRAALSEIARSTVKVDSE